MSDPPTWSWTNGPGDDEGDVSRFFPHWHGGFEYRDVLGKGGFGIVYLAVQRSLDRLVALKVLRPTLGRDPRFVELLREEAYTMAAIRSHRVVTVHDLPDAGDPPFIVMEFVDGSSLADHLGPRVDGRRPPRPMEEACLIARAIADALRDLQSNTKPIAHRDLTPRNLMLVSRSVKVLDLGLARAAYRRRREGVALADEEFGPAPGFTPEYAAPEQILGLESTPRADWFSFGAILFELLCGRLPFGDDRGAAYALGVLERDPRWQLLQTEPTDADDSARPDARTELHPACRELLERCLVKDPAERSISADDAERLLDQALESPPPRPARRRTNNLPPLDDELPLVGRDVELATITQALRRSPAAQVVLHGAPGVGKTRLALEAAHELMRSDPTPWSSRFCWVSLRGLDPGRGDAGVLEATSAALVSLSAGAAIQTTLSGVLDQFLDDRPTLLILDNADSLSAQVAAIAESVRGRHRHVRILVTTTDPTPFPAHTLRRVDPLRSPSEAAQRLAEVEATPAAMLFVRFLQQHVPGFRLTDRLAAPIAGICARLGGIPLALRLVASTGARFDPPRMLAELDSIIAADLDRAGPYASVDALMRVGLDLLTPGERRLLARLSVFRGGWSDHFAEAVCGDAGAATEYASVDGQAVWAQLEWLERRGIVQPLGSGRRDILEPMRRRAEAMLVASGELASLEERFREAFMASVRESIVGHQPDGWSKMAWLDLLAPEAENLRRLWTLCADLSDHTARGLALTTIVRGLDVLWLERGVPADAWSWVEAALGQVEVLPTPRDRMSLLNAAASTAMILGRFDDAERLWDRARSIADSVEARVHKVIFAANRSLNALRGDRPPAAIVHADEALVLAGEAGLAASVGGSGTSPQSCSAEPPCEPVLQALLSKADALKRLGALEEARAMLEALEAPLHAAGDETRLHEVEVGLGQIALAESRRVAPALVQARLAEAARRLRDARARNRRHRGNRVEAAMGMFLHGVLSAFRGGHPSAAARIERGWQRYLGWGGLSDRFLEELRTQGLQAAPRPAGRAAGTPPDAN